MSEVLVIDNFDSFTYNLVHLIEGLGNDVTVIRNDKLKSIEIDKFKNILISPGPGTPEHVPQVKEFVLDNCQSKNILGVCLGHQLIAECFGGQNTLTSNVFHGISTSIKVNNQSKLFQGLPQSFHVGRYHSWIVNNLKNSQLAITAETIDGVIMAFEHKSLSVYGIQFHPESILSEFGKEVISNWLN